jgi:hypothetical protein
MDILVTDALYSELVTLSLFLLFILLYNNLVLFKSGFSDKITLLLIATILITFIELFVDTIIEIANENAKAVLNYLIYGLYTMTVFIIGALLNCSVMERFGVIIRKSLLYIIPGCFLLLLSVTTPWTHLLYMVDDENIMQFLPAFDYIVTSIFFLYVLTPIIPIVRIMIKERKSHKEYSHTAFNYIIFLVLIFLIYAIQTFILKGNDYYFVASIMFSYPLVYLVTNLNTDTVIKSQNRIATVEADLNIAANIQYGSLPSVNHIMLTHPKVQIYASMKTAKEVGGDFYDFFEIDSTHIGFVIADVSGKGVPAALFMMTVKTMIKDHASMKRSTAEIFTDVNRLLCENNPEEMFATAWIGILDTETYQLTYTNAGHNSPCFAKAGEGFEFLKKRHGLMLAGMEETVYKEATLGLQRGDTIFLYTDGVTEAHNAEGGLYGDSRLIAMLNRLDNRGEESFLWGIQQDVDAFCAQTEQFDDITMLLVHLA